LDRFVQELRRTLEVVSRHRRWVSSAAIAGLSGFAITAFGLAPMAPDAAALPQRMIEQPLVVEGLEAQIEALERHRLQLVRHDVTRFGDTMDTVLRRLGVDDPQAVTFLRSDERTRSIAQGGTGRMFAARVSAQGRLLQLVVRYPGSTSGESTTSRFTRLTVDREGSLWRVSSEQVPLGSTLRLGSGTIERTLFAATDRAGVPDAVAVQLAEIFSTEVDFHRDLRRGDQFSVVYEVMTADGEPVAWSAGAARVRAAEFVNAGRRHSAVWFDATGSGKGAYYDLQGRSLQRTFLASPVEFSRQTSGFAMRLHPILGVWRQHLGVDYAAPTGTPVRAVGDGVVTFAGWRGGYGNVVEVDHGNDHITLYAHLSRVDVANGQRLEQGDNVGVVGATGWATGPHLHFEFRVAGQHQDPRQMASAAAARTLDTVAAQQFTGLALVSRSQLDLAGSLGTTLME
jgi:murein DD-endopeptidase MepM/ murein hydrolase activator NlpD